jgi:3-hydroxybutyrate dehydrogenase
MPVKNKVVFITGAASGIGLEIARQFAREGASVVLTDIDKAAIAGAVSGLRQEHEAISGIECDVTSESRIVRAMDQAVETFGRIDILINNAGVQFVSRIEDFPTDKFELLIKIMLVGSFITTKNVFPMMKKQGFGRIINMASVNGLIGFAGKVAYNSAKHGVIGLTKVAALEGAEHQITVNALCPGYVDTPLLRNQLSDLAKTRNIPVSRVMEEIIFPLVPQKRLLRAEEIAHYAVFLADEKAAGITGQAIVIDGGYTAQ